MEWGYLSAEPTLHNETGSSAKQGLSQSAAFPAFKGSQPGVSVLQSCPADASIHCLQTGQALLRGIQGRLCPPDDSRIPSPSLRRNWSRGKGESCDYPAPEQHCFFHSCVFLSLKWCEYIITLLLHINTDVNSVAHIIRKYLLCNLLGLAERSSWND